MTPITAEVGCMYSGKSSELIQLVERYERAEKINGQDFLVFNHASDTRYAQDSLASHAGKDSRAIAVSDPRDILLTFADVYNGSITLKPEYQGRLKTVFIDEGQFFGQKDEHGYILPRILKFIDDLGIDVFIAGLDTDFRGEPFEPIPEVMAIAHEVHKHHAVCTYPGCGNIEADRTQRLINDKPANYSDPIILVGAEESYTARCRKHHIVPGNKSKSDLHTDLKTQQQSSSDSA